MDRYNVLILSAGRRVELVQEFQKAAQRLGIVSDIVAGDTSPYAPALFLADKSVLLPKIEDPLYLERIIEVCNAENIRLIVPTIDTDLLLLSENKARIESETDAIVLISSIEMVRTCRDKILTQLFLEKHEFGVPKMYELDNLDPARCSYPMFIKPKSGSSSINAYKVHNEAELRTYLNLIENPILQEYVAGDEYTVDVFVDFTGNIVSICPRLRMATRGGEISKGRISKDPVIIEDVRRLISVLGGIGHLTVQLKKDGDVIKYIEVNPRFGGGAPMSIQSGANSCEYLYTQLQGPGQTLQYNENYMDGLTFMRFDSSICIDGHGQPINPSEHQKGMVT